MTIKTVTKQLFPITQVISLLEKEEAPAVDRSAAQPNDPFKVLVATILSARTKDEVTAAASRRLFAQADTPETLALLSVSDLEKIIFPVGFFPTKALYLHQLSAALAK